MSFWWRVIVALLVGAHGVGHILFLLPLWGMADWGQSARSWLLGALLIFHWPPVAELAG